MALNTVVTTYDYDIGDTVYYKYPQTSADVAFHKVSLQVATVQAKRNYLEPTTVTPTIAGPAISSVQYDIRFMDNSVKTVKLTELIPGIATVSETV